jgi:hypothetical protein
MTGTEITDTSARPKPGGAITRRLAIVPSPHSGPTAPTAADDHSESARRSVIEHTGVRVAEVVVLGRDLLLLTAVAIGVIRGLVDGALRAPTALETRPPAPGPRRAGGTRRLRVVPSAAPTGSPARP